MESWDVQGGLEGCWAVVYSLSLIRRSLMTAGHASGGGGEALGGWPKSGGAGHVTHTRLRAQLVGGGCVEEDTNMCVYTYVWT